MEWVDRIAERLAANPERLIDRCRNKSRVLVRRYWPAVEAVVAALLENGEASHEEVEAAVNRLLDQQADRSWQRTLSRAKPRASAANANEGRAEFIQGG